MQSEQTLCCLQIPSLHERLTVSGPYIVLLGCDSAQSIWRASVMIVTPPEQGAVLPVEPVLMLSDQGAFLASSSIQTWRAWAMYLC